MAGRPPKGAIDFSSWAVDIFDNDQKIDRLLDAQGAAGFLIYFYLCQRASGSTGYFYAWCYEDAATTVRKIGSGISAGTVKETVGYCLRIGLFDKGLFVRWNILTSIEIQKMFWQVARARTYRKVIPEYWLLENSECEGIEYDAPKSNYEPPKSNYAGAKSNYELGKESKVKKRKVKSSEEKGKPLSPSQQAFKQAFPEKVIDCDIPPDIDIERLIKEVSLSKFLREQPNITLKSCVKLHERILAGNYRDDQPAGKDESQSVLDPLLQALENRRRRNHETDN